MSANIGDCVLAGNGWAYLFPKVDQWVAIHSVELATGVETLSPYASIYAGDHAVLTSDGTAMYTVTSGLSPANIDRWTVSGGAAVHAWASPYWGSYAMGPLLWTSADGARVFTSAGTAFRSSGAQAQDLQYNGTFMPGGVTWLDSSPTEVAAIPQVNPYAYPPSTLTDGTVEILGNEVLGHLDRIMLPRWQVGPYSYAVHGRFVFYGAGYAKKHVIVQADGASGLLHDTAVLTY